MKRAGFLTSPWAARKRKVLYWFAGRVLHIRDGYKYPGWLLWIVFPYRMLISRIAESLFPVQYDMMRDTYTINGKVFSSAFFEIISSSDYNRCFRIVQGGWSGSVTTVRTVDPCTLRLICSEKGSGSDT